MAVSDHNDVKVNVHIDRGDITGKTWDGDFTFKPILSFADQMKVERFKRDLLGAGPYDGIDPVVIIRASILAKLSAFIVEAPSWWGNGLNHSDDNLLEELYNKLQKIQEDYSNKILSDGNSAQKDLATKG